jgi:hypothetical protein
LIIDVRPAWESIPINARATNGRRVKVERDSEQPDDRRDKRYIFRRVRNE